MTRADIVAEARSWIGTPWHHQASLKGKGCDCIGLIAGVGRELGLPEALAFFKDARFRAYGRTPDPVLLRQAVAEYLDPTDDIELGDILMLRFERDPQHFAIVSALDPMYIVHAYAQQRRVVENRVDEQWRARSIGAYRYRGL